MKKILALALAILMLISLVACGKDQADAEKKENNEEYDVLDNMVYENLTYGINPENGLFEITGYIRTNTDKIDLEIPAEIDGRDVVGIAAGAFDETSAYINSVKLPENITYIGDHAFFGCKYITTITLPSTVKEIGYGAFEGCTALETVTLSENLVTIGNGAFKDCVALKNVTIPAKVTTIGFAAFWNCDTITEVAIPESVTTIGEAAFYGCDKLAKATVTDKTTKIGEIVFNACAESFVITAPANSEFEKYAVANGYTVVNPTPAA